MEINRIPSVKPNYLNSDLSIVERTSSLPGQEAENAPIEPVAAVYEPSDSLKENNLGKTYKPDTATIAKLKAEVELRTDNLRRLVEQLLLQQGYKLQDATNIYRLLREGKVQVDPETAAKAQEEISEDGYWGVKQTSERIFQFALAITGGDSSKAEEAKKAITAGYEAAKKVWGGDLPEICQKTYDESLRKIDEWAAGKKEVADSEANN